MPRAWASAILELCVDVGGTVTGEHGVGVEKLNSMCGQFTADELEQMHRVKAAFDPDGSAQSRQGGADARALRRSRRHARPRRQRCPFPELCRDSDCRAIATMPRCCSMPSRRACAPSEPSVIAGSGSKAFLARPTCRARRRHAAVDSITAASSTTAGRTGDHRARRYAAAPDRRRARRGRPDDCRSNRRASPAAAPSAVRLRRGYPGPVARGAARSATRCSASTLVNGRAQAAAFRRAVMKNVAGYDSLALQAGAFGTLGLLLAVSVKVLPRPAARIAPLRLCSTATSRSRAAVRGRDRRTRCRRPVTRRRAARAAVGRRDRRSPGPPRGLGGDGGRRRADFWSAVRDQTLAFFPVGAVLWRRAAAGRRVAARRLVDRTGAAPSAGGMRGRCGRDRASTAGIARR